jgi:hypothetical protein
MAAPFCLVGGDCIARLMCSVLDMTLLFESHQVASHKTGNEPLGAGTV